MATSYLTPYYGLQQDRPQPYCAEPMSLSFTLPLKDGALGTIPLSHQQPTMSLIKADASYVVAAIPRILSAVTSSIIQRRREASWAELRDIFFYILISLLELQLILSLSLLWLVLPGLVLVPWLSLQIAFIWFLSGFQDVPRPYTFAADKVEEGIPVSNEQALDWYVVGGFFAR